MEVTLLLNRMMPVVGVRVEHNLYDVHKSWASSTVTYISRKPDKVELDSDHGGAGFWPSSLSSMFCIDLFM